MKKMDRNSSLRSILKLVLLPINKTRGITPCGAVEKNLGFSGGLYLWPDEQKHEVFKDFGKL